MPLTDKTEAWKNVYSTWRRECKSKMMHKETNSDIKDSTGPTEESARITLILSEMLYFWTWQSSWGLKHWLINLFRW